MTIETAEATLYDYRLHSFGRTQQLFRGPAVDSRLRHIACLGAEQTFGRFARAPFPALLADALAAAGHAIPVANLGVDGAGPGLFSTDAELLRAAGRAELCIVQVMGAAPMSNRLYTVRPRRNGRLAGVSDLLLSIYPDVEFERFQFVRPMLRHLGAIDPLRFQLVENEIRSAWIGRMQTLLASLGTRTLLFWFGLRRPGDPAGLADAEPAFVDSAMVEAVSAYADGYVEVASRAGIPQDLTDGGRPRLFAPGGVPIAANRDLPSPEMHGQAAAALMPEVRRLLRLG